MFAARKQLNVYAQPALLSYAYPLTPVVIAERPDCEKDVHTVSLGKKCDLGNIKRGCGFVS